MAEDSETLENENGSPELELLSAGETLKRAREQKNQTLEDIAKTTRIPIRHLESIETGDFEALPGRTYAIGFAKSYARTVGLSDATIGSKLREEMDEQGHAAYQPETSGYSPANPSNIPPKYLAWSAAGIGAVILVGYVVWRTLVLDPGEIAMADAGDQPPVVPTAIDEPAVSQGNTETPSATGPVVLTATDSVWMKIYDEEGERLFENEMAAGDQFTVPADANNPQILTGRPDALTVTVDGQVIPPLGTAERTIKDVPVSAAALLSRGETVAADVTESEN